MAVVGVAEEGTEDTEGQGREKPPTAANNHDATATATATVAGVQVGSAASGPVPSSRGAPRLQSS